MKIFILLLITFTGFVSLAEEIRLRPLTWAQPVIGSKLKNWYKLDEYVYRSKQPSKKEFKMLEKFGIKSVLNLRRHHSDDDEAEGTTIKLYRVKVNAGSMTYDDILKALRIIKNAEKPVLVHCWHGADRTGTVCAAYRMVFQGWSTQEALDEMVHGGYHFHARTYKNLPVLLKGLDVEKLKKDLNK